MGTRDPIITDAWHVSVEECTLTFRDKRSRKSHQKVYGSPHAATCAMGRMRHDERMIGAIVGKLIADEMAGRPTSNPPQPKLTAEHVLAVAWQQLSPKDRIKVENDILDAADEGIDVAEARALVSRLNEELGD